MAGRRLVITGRMARHTIILYCLIRPVCAETYSDCILEHLKDAKSEPAAELLLDACRKKSLPEIPKNCYGSGNYFDRFDTDPATGKPVEPNQDCIVRCREAAAWSKRFGDCAP